MRWIRNQKTWASRLALFALALQLVLSFGHGHATPSHIEAAGNIALSDTAPGHKHTHHKPDCAICATAHLADTLVLPPTAVLPLPEATPFVWQVSFAETFAGHHTASFRARAPPQF